MNVENKLKKSTVTNENNQQSDMTKVSLTVVFHNCTINVDERQNNSKNNKKDQKGCTINNK